MAEFPIMQVMTDAYLGDTKHLTTTEHGAYFLLLMAMWRSGGTLPLDDKFIARTAGLSSTQWKRIRPTIMGFMRTVAGEQFTQPKLLEALNAVRRHSHVQSDRARARWLKLKGLPDAVASPWQCHGNANHNKNSTYLPVQSSTPPEKQEGSAEKPEPVASSATIIVSPALAARYTNRKTG